MALAWDDPVPARERWRPVRDWPGYRVSDLGNVKTVTRTLTDGRRCGGVQLTPFPGKDGYLCVTLSRGKRRKVVPVHVLVMGAFHGKRPPGMERLHGPAGQAGNSAANLRYGTHAENEADKRRWPRAPAVHASGPEAGAEHVPALG
jgi:hypothetical protein